MQDVLPFPDPPMGGKVGPTMQESVHKMARSSEPFAGARADILIVMLDDAGFGQSSTFGGEIDTPTLSPSGRGRHLLQPFPYHGDVFADAGGPDDRPQPPPGSAGQIAEFANDWDGYTGVIPKSSATIAEVLGHDGYATSAFGKEHNTPVDQLANGPYDRTPTGRGYRLFVRIPRG